MRDYQEKYIENLMRIIEMSHVPGQLPDDAAVFLRERKEKAGEVHRLAAENTAQLRENLFPVLDNIISADEEEIEELQAFSNGLTQGAQQLDPVLIYSIHTALLAYARKWEKRDMLIKELYQTGMALFYMQEILSFTGQRRYQWKMSLMFGEAASYIKEYDDIEDPETRGYIHRSMANLALCHSEVTLEESQKKLRAIRRSLQVLEDPTYHSKTPSLPWDLFLYKSHQERSTAIAILRAGITDPEVQREVMESAEYVKDRQMESCRKNGTEPSIRWQLTYEAAQYHCGLKTMPEFLQILETVYIERNPKDYTGNGLYLNMFVPALYADYLQHNEEYREKKRAVLDHMYRQVVRYVRNVPDHQMDNLLLRYLLSCLLSFVEYPDGIQKKDFLLHLVVCRNTDVYVFLRMTAQISKMLTGKALQEQPELLVGVLGCDSVSQVKANGDKLCQFAYESGLLHDVGILAFNSMLTHYGRSWLQEEKEMYQLHVYGGEDMLKECSSTKIYAATALGHHKYYDGSAGYPPEYDRNANPNQAVTDIVSAAAFLVRLIDDMNYTDRQPMTLPQALKKVREYSGTRFSPDIVSLLSGMEPELEEYFKTGQLKAHEEAFLLLQKK